MRVRMWVGLLVVVLAAATVAAASDPQAARVGAAGTGVGAADECEDLCPDGDLDDDNVPDDVDQCPDAPGPLNWQGCPDTDLDGIPDHIDACPQDFATTPDGCPANPDPVAQPDEAAVPYDALGHALPVNVNVIANDFDPDGGSVSITDIPATTGTGWRVSIAEDGSLAFIPPATFSGRIVFEYEISSDRGSLARTTVTLTGTPPIACQPYDMDITASRSGQVIEDADWSHRFTVCRNAASGAFVLDGFDGISRVPSRRRTDIPIAYSSTPVRVVSIVTTTENRLAARYSASLVEHHCVSLPPLRALRQQLGSTSKWAAARFTLRLGLLKHFGADTGGRLADQINSTLGTSAATVCAQQSLVKWSATVDAAGTTTLRWSTGDVAQYTNPVSHGQLATRNAVVVRSAGLEIGRAYLHPNAASVTGKLTCTAPTTCRSRILEQTG